MNNFQSIRLLAYSIFKFDMQCTHCTLCILCHSSFFPFIQCIRCCSFSILFLTRLCHSYSVFIYVHQFGLELCNRPIEARLITVLTCKTVPIYLCYWLHSYNKHYLTLPYHISIREGFKKKIKKKYGIFHTFQNPPTHPPLVWKKKIKKSWSKNHF